MASTPSTRHLLDGVEVPNSHCSTEPARPHWSRVRPTHWLIYAQVTDDTDATTFASYYAQNTPKIVKNLFDTEGARLKEKRPAYEIDVSTVLSSLQLSREQFVDFCVLCGCDYAQKLRGVGPKTALKLIVTHKTLERAVFVERPGVAT